MENEFVSYTQALALKELGFDEESFGHYRTFGKNLFYATPIARNLPARYRVINAPLYQQAFRFFREKHNLQAEMVFSEKPDRFYYYIGNMVTGDMDRGINMSYEEAESSCLYKLIEITKNKTND